MAVDTRILPVDQIHYRHTLYARYYTMLARCNNPKFFNFHRYGGRGIKVCREWMEDKRAFFRWALTNGFQAHLELDRRENNGDYTPDNCRWVTVSVNRKNKEITPKVKANLARARLFAIAAAQRRKAANASTVTLRAYA